MNTMKIKGEVAELRWGYHVVATLSGWSVEGTPGAWTFTARAHNVDDFTASQRPLVVVTPNGWRWMVTPESLQMMDGTLTASLSPEE